MVSFLAIATHLAEILVDPLLAVFKGFVRPVTAAANGDEKNQPTKQKCHPADY